MHRAPLVALILAVSACSSNTGGSAPATIPDEDVRRIHATMLDAMGGARAWESARYFEFDWAVERNGQRGNAWSHRWDRWNGDYRLTGIRNGQPLVVLMNVNQRDAGGQAWLGGEPMTGARLDSLITFAYGRFINDSYWLIMPYKWTDPGVNLSYEGRRTDEDGREWEVVKLTFASVGLTPQNEYLAWIDPASGLMERWYHFSRAGAEPSISNWTDWQSFGPIRLATKKPAAAGNAMIFFENVRVDTRVPAGAFEPPL